MSRRDGSGQDDLEWTLPDINALKPPQDPAARAALRAEMQATWTGEIPVLRDLGAAESVADTQTPPRRRGRHAASDADHPAPDGTEPGRSWLLVPRPEGRRGRHAAVDADATAEIGNLAQAVRDQEAAEASAGSVEAAATAAPAGPAGEPISLEDTVVIAGAPLVAGGAEGESGATAAGPASAPFEPGWYQSESGESAQPEPGPSEIPDLADQAGSGDDPEGRPKRIGVRTPALVVGVAAACLLTGGAGTFAAMDKSVSITVDGQTRAVSTLSGDVAGALRAAGLTVGEHDALAPSPGTAIHDGSQIRLDRGRLLTVEIDGQQRQIWTTARTVDQALVELGADDSRIQLSANRSRAIPLQGLDIVGTTERTVDLEIAGKSTSTTTTARTVADLLREKNITLRDNDEVVPDAATDLADGSTVTVIRRTVVRTAERRTLPQPADRTVSDGSVRRHRTVVTEGRPGIEELRYQTVTTNGRKGARNLVSTKVIRTAEPTTTHVGTKIVEEQDAWNVPWDQMAMCESSGKWDINTGNGTYGGLQFMTSTWLAMGGGAFAPRADLATKAQQIQVAEKLYAQQGLAPWHCARLLGWGFDKYTGGW